VSIDPQTSWLIQPRSWTTIEIACEHSTKQYFRKDAFGRAWLSDDVSEREATIILCCWFGELVGAVSLMYGVTTP
jgi:hypothetical protein